MRTNKIIQNIVLILCGLNFILPAFYSVGDTINIEHLSVPLEICHGSDENDTGNIITLGNNLGKITILGLEIPW
tara:strand:- start:72 stop:293 length:222 start_codon:yes stop_codon:yes gene_type:complete